MSYSKKNQKEKLKKEKKFILAATGA